MHKKPVTGARTAGGALLHVQRVLHILSLFSTALAARLADRLFFRPLPTPVLKREEAVMQRAQRHELCNAGRRLALYSWGEGPTVLLVHGWGARASRLAHLAPRLNALGYRVLAFDAPGHGLSEGRESSIVDLQGVLRQVQDEYGPFHGIVAHSFGALASLYGLAHGLQAQKAVLISMPADFGALVDKYQATMQLNPAVTAALQRRVQKRFAAHGSTFAEVVAHFSPQRYVGAVQAETLLLHDSEDKEVPARESQDLAAVWPQARLVVTQGLGHQRLLHDAAVMDMIVGVFALQPAAGTGEEVYGA